MSKLCVPWRMCWAKTEDFMNSFGGLDVYITNACKNTRGYFQDRENIVPVITKVGTGQFLLNKCHPRASRLLCIAADLLDAAHGIKKLPTDGAEESLLDEFQTISDKYAAAVMDSIYHEERDRAREATDVLRKFDMQSEMPVPDCGIKFLHVIYKVVEREAACLESDFGNPVLTPYGNAITALFWYGYQCGKEVKQLED